MIKRFLKDLKLFFLPCEENKFFPFFLKKRVLNFCLLILLILKIQAISLIILLPQNTFFADISRVGVMELINNERANRGLAVLEENPKLNTAAYLKAKDILEKDYFAHISPEGISPWHWFEQAGYNYQFAGENLAVGFMSPQQVHQAWMNSPSHRENVLNPNYKEMGVSVLKGNFQGQELYVIVNHLGFEQATIQEPVTEEPVIEEEIIEEEITEGPVIEEEIIEEEIIEEKETIGNDFVLEESVEREEEEEEEEKIITDIEIRDISPEVAPMMTGIDDKPGITYSVVNFASRDYHSILQKMTYSFLIFIILSLLLTIIFDIFVYRRFVIDYKELIPRTFLFCSVLVFFIFLDQLTIISLISNNFLIYGI